MNIHSTLVSFSLWTKPNRRVSQGKGKYSMGTRSKMDKMESKSIIDFKNYLHNIC